MFKKILVAVDNSEIAVKGFKAALDIAGKYGAQITAVTVISLPDYSSTVGEVTEAKSEGQARGEQILAKFIPLAESQGFSFEKKILFGHPAEKLVSYATKQKCDLIVIGHKGMSRIEKFLLGSVATKVIHHAPCTVMLIR